MVQVQEVPQTQTLPIPLQNGWTRISPATQPLPANYSAKQAQWIILEQHEKTYTPLERLGRGLKAIAYIIATVFSSLFVTSDRKWLKDLLFSKKATILYVVQSITLKPSPTETTNSVNPQHSPLIVNEAISTPTSPVVPLDQSAPNVVPPVVLQPLPTITPMQNASVLKRINFETITTQEIETLDPMLYDDADLEQLAEQISHFYPKFDDCGDDAVPGWLLNKVFQKTGCEKLVYITEVQFSALDLTRLIKLKKFTYVHIVDRYGRGAGSNKSILAQQLVKHETALLPLLNNNTQRIMNNIRFSLRNELQNNKHLAHLAPAETISRIVNALHID